jgi:hypothetical protein
VFLSCLTLDLATTAMDNANTCVSVAGLLHCKGFTISEDFGLQMKKTIVEKELLIAQVKVSTFYDVSYAKMIVEL